MPVLKSPVSKWAAALVASGLLLACASEALLRLAWNDAYLSPPVFRKTQGADVHGLSGDAQVKVRQFGRILSMSTTAAGNRAVTRAPASATQVVHLVGDSQAFGWGLSDEETIASRLQAELGPKVLVVNWGVPSYGPIEYAHVLRGLPKQDHVVLLHTEENDAADSYKLAAGKAVTCGHLANLPHAETAVRCALMQLRIVQAALVLFSDSQRGYHMTPLGFSEYSEVAAAVLHRRVHRLYESEREQRGRRLLFSVIPWKGRYSTEWSATYAPPPRADAGSMSSLFTDDVDMPRRLRGLENLYIDGDTHLSAAGADVVARVLATDLRPRLLATKTGGSN